MIPPRHSDDRHRAHDADILDQRGGRRGYFAFHSGNEDDRRASASALYFHTAPVHSIAGARRFHAERPTQNRAQADDVGLRSNNPDYGAARAEDSRGIPFYSRRRRGTQRSR